jgi:hypothetical protein
MNHPFSRSQTLSQYRRLKAFVLVALLLLATFGTIDSSAAGPKGQAASDQTATTPSTAWHHNLDAKWGGHLKATGSASWPDDRTWYQLVGTRTYYDGGLDFRLKNKLYLSDWGNFETHYEAILYGGDTRRKSQELQEVYPNLAILDQLTQTTINDAQRLFDLTSVIEENDTYVLYHRLDRFVLTWQPEWGTAKLGRQAVTWGNGFLFNPMDLFNPFAPTDVIRDYKIGVDMANILLAVSPSTDLQLLYVPRRDIVSGNVEWEESSLAAKLHFPKGTTEFEVMAAYHYQDHIAGIGSTGYLANAAWRLDATWTFLHSKSAKDDYLSLVANMDYSWVWNEKNVHGFIEYFYNGLGKTDYAEALTDPDIYERFLRGELFTFGRHYLSGEVQLEIHPLFKTFLSIITNIEDPSGVIQPRAEWDVITNLQCTMGANLYFGKTGTEYGGFPIPDTPFLYVPADRVYIWLTYYF